MTVAPVDRLALSDLVHRYAAGVDDRRFDDVLGLFTSDATLWLPDPPASLEPTAAHRGLNAISRAVHAVAATARTQHAIVGEVYSQQAGGARGRVSCIAHHWNDRDDDGPTDVTWHLRYDDEYVRTDAGWRFRARRLTIDAIASRQMRRLRPEAT